MPNPKHPTKNLSYGIILHSQWTKVKHSAGAAPNHGYVYVTGRCRWRALPPNWSARPHDRTQSKHGNPCFFTLADALASGLGDQKQLRALAAGKAYSSDAVVPPTTLSEEDAELISREIYLAACFDNGVREIERWRRAADIEAIIEVAAKAGDDRPRLLQEEISHLEEVLTGTHRAIREAKQRAKQDRDRGDEHDGRSLRKDDPELAAQVTAVRSQLNTLREEFRPYYKREKTQESEELEALARKTRRTSDDKRDAEDFEPTFVSRRDALKQALKDARKQGLPTDHIKQELEALTEEKQAHDVIFEAAKARLLAADPRARVEAQAKEKFWTLYNETFAHLSSGSRMGVRNKYKKGSVAYARLRKGAPPKHKKFFGDGSLYTEYQKGLTVDDLMSGRRSTSLTLDSNNSTRGTLQLPIAGQVVSIPLAYHRELPRDGLIRSIRIKQVSDASKARSPRTRWDGLRLTAVFSVQSATYEAAPRTSGLTAAFAPAYRRLDSGDVRIGVLVRSDGYQAELRMSERHRAVYLVPFGRKLGVDWESIPTPAKMRALPGSRSGRRHPRHGIPASLDYADQHNAGQLKDDLSHLEGTSARDARFLLCKERLVHWIKANEPRIPEWLLGRSQRLRQGKFNSKENFQVLAHLYMSYFKEPQDPFLVRNHLGELVPKPLHAIAVYDRPTDAELEVLPRYRKEMMHELWLWTHEDRHARAHQSGNSGRTRRFRSDTYRRFAHWIGIDCAVLKVQDTSLTKYLAEEGGLESVQRRQAKSAALGDLVAFMSEAVISRGGRAGYIDPDLPEGQTWSPTHTHYVCGERSDRSTSEKMLWCPTCKVHYDCDLNAAMNTLAAPIDWIRVKKDS